MLLHTNTHIHSHATPDCSPRGRSTGHSPGKYVRLHTHTHPHTHTPTHNTHTHAHTHTHTHTHTHAHINTHPHNFWLLTTWEVNRSLPRWVRASKASWAVAVRDSWWGVGPPPAPLDAWMASATMSNLYMDTMCMCV